ncbi:MAG: hypothetical protein ACI9KK_001508, partial [Ascidiaceihabitans sp.]
QVPTPFATPIAVPGQTQRQVPTPFATPIAVPGQTPQQVPTPFATPIAVPDQTPQQVPTPFATPIAVPDQTPQQVPTPFATPIAVPGQTPRQVPTPFETPIAVPGQTPQQVPTPFATPIAVPDQTPQQVPTLIPRPTVRPTKTTTGGTVVTTKGEPTVTHSVTHVSPPQGVSHVTNLTGRQPAHALPKFADRAGQGTWTCVTSGHGRRKVGSTGRARSNGALRHLGNVDALATDVPARHPRHAGCITSVKRRKK